jgi:hypothetical protein
MLRTLSSGMGVDAIGGRSISVASVICRPPFAVITRESG